MDIIAIAAVGKDNSIGKNGGLIWSIPDDMKHFKDTTMNHPIIMGRKTLESFPGRRPLPGRVNIVITRNTDLTVNNPKDVPVRIVSSVDEAIKVAEEYDSDAAYVIGGASIYKQFADKYTKLDITEIDAECKDADAFFNYMDIGVLNSIYTSEKYIHDGVSYRFCLYSVERGA